MATPDLGGRPPKYTDPEEMRKKAQEYFDACKGHYLYDEDGNPFTDKYGCPIVFDAEPITVTGLALALGFNSRQSLLNYQADARFVDTVTWAKGVCEQYAEKRLYDRDGTRGAAFSLQHNFRWTPEKDDTPKTGVGIVILPEVKGDDE